MRLEKAREFEQHIEAAAFPCVVGKAALAQDNLVYFQARDIRSDACDRALHKRLVEFGQRLTDDEKVFQSFVAIYERPLQMAEEDFEKCLWDRLNALHRLDVEKGIGWAEGVSPDPKSVRFSMSVGGQAYFVIGLHPGASRPARRFSSPALVFNSHDQFEALRDAGIFEKIRRTIRKRDADISDAPNDMLADYGEACEARQYSGRSVGKDWDCPFRFLG